MKQGYSGTESPVRSAEEAERRRVERMIAMSNGTYERQGVIRLGIPRLNDILDGGLTEGRFYVLASKTSYGKTAFAVHVAAVALGAGRKVLFASLEMPRKEICRRIVSNLAECRFPQSQKIWEGSRTLAEKDGSRIYERLFDERQELARRLRFIGNMQRSKFFATIRAMFRREAFDLMVLDYIHLLNGEDGESLSFTEELHSVYLKRLAMDLGVPVLATAQINRTQENEDGQSQMNDIRGSVSTIQNADVVLVLDKENHFETEDPRNAKRTIKVAKNRFGHNGETSISFDFLTYRVNLGEQK